MAESCPQCSRLADIEAIKQLKARYFRLMDEQDWSAFGEVFSREVVLGDDGSITGRAAAIEYIRSAAHAARTAHQGVAPEIEIVADGQARGVWAMTDYFEVRDTDPPIGFTGYGHYFDDYVHEDGAWRIAASRLTRLKIVPMPGGLPSFYQRRDED
jgi:hypothetical protein